MATQETEQKALPPKKPLSAFFIYLRENYDRVTAAQPEIKITEVTKLISNDWKQLDEAAKKPYQDRAEAAKREYEVTYSDYVSKYGKPEKRKKKVKKEKKQKSEDKKAKKAAKKALHHQRRKEKKEKKAALKANKKAKKASKGQKNGNGAD